MAEVQEPTRVQEMAVPVSAGAITIAPRPNVRPPAEARTAVQRAAWEREQTRQWFVASAYANEAMISRSLKHQGITFDFFMAALELGLRNTLKGDDKFFEVVSIESFLEAVLKGAFLGLVADGKEGAIVRFKDQAAFLPMVEGFVKKIWQSGVVVEVNHNVVCEGDDFDFEEGDNGFVRHRRSLKRKADAEVIGAWCVVKLKTGGTLIEVVDQVDLAKIAKVSRAEKGPRQDWAKEMHRKAPFRRIVKRMPKDQALGQLIAHDDTAYDLTRLAAAERTERLPAIPRAALFTDKAHVKRTDEPAPAEEGAAAASEPEVVDPVAAAVDRMLGCERIEDLETVVQAIMEDPELAEGNLDAESIAWLKETEETVRAELQPAAEDPPAEGEAQSDEPAGEEAPASDAIMIAVISSATGERAYSDPKRWLDDILAKMAAVKGDPAVAFWKTNLPHVLEAKATGAAEQADRILEVAAGRGWPVELPHD